MRFTNGVIPNMNHLSFGSRPRLLDTCPLSSSSQVPYSLESLLGEKLISPRVSSTSLSSPASSTSSTCSSSPLSGLLEPSIGSSTGLFMSLGNTGTSSQNSFIKSSSQGLLSEPCLTSCSSPPSLSPTHLSNFSTSSPNSHSGLSYSVSLNVNDSSASHSPTSLSSEAHKKLDRSLSEPVEKFSKCSNNGRSQANSSRYKTELCRPFEENGTCKYGDKCQFAHGSKELRTLQRHPKYKTELCQTFHTTGFCPYGPRCHFIHNSEESKKNVINSLQASIQSSPKANTKLDGSDIILYILNSLQNYKLEMDNQFE